MRIPGRVIAGLVGLSLTVLGTVPAQAQTTSSDETDTRCSAATVLSPKNEVRPPDTTDPVDSRAFGAATIHVKDTTLRYSVVIINLKRETFVAGHIHAAPADENGPVVVELFSGESRRGFFTQFESTEITADQAAQICGNVAGHYVNYHTAQDPQGAVRGQLHQLR